MTPEPPACSDPSCYELATVTVTRSRRLAAAPVCDSHAHYEALLAERFGYALVIQALEVPRYSNVPLPGLDSIPGQR